MSLADPIRLTWTRAEAKRIYGGGDPDEDLFRGVYVPSEDEPNPRVSVDMAAPPARASRQRSGDGAYGRNDWGVALAGPPPYEELRWMWATGWESDEFLADSGATIRP